MEGGREVIAEGEDVMNGGVRGKREEGIEVGVCQRVSETMKRVRAEGISEYRSEGYVQSLNERTLFLSNAVLTETEHQTPSLKQNITMSHQTSN